MLILIQIIAIVVALALILWGIAAIPMEGMLKSILSILVALVAAIWVLTVGGLLHR